MDAEIALYNRSLDVALKAYMKGDEEPLAIHCRAWNMEEKIPNHPVAKRGAVMKMVTSRASLPMPMRSEAKRWLKKNGFQSWDDGDVPT